MKKVFVGLSGGVDSSVSALLLKKLGYEVVGVFIRGWQPDWIPCTWKTDRISAMRTAAYLEIPFVTLDLEKEYKDKVVSYMLSEYEKGNTPNPDMLCNREIKFGYFLRWAVKNGADYVATGHYAQVFPPLRKGEKYSFFESKDKEKDQTYFLSQLTQNELSKILFPIGHLEKSEVRKIAMENKLPVATRKDSQGICFVGDLEMSEFLKRELSPVFGKVLDTSGREIGEHEGAILYTIGQRHGFRIYDKNEERKHVYVVQKNLQNNTITVSDIFSFTNEGLKEKDKLKVRNFSFAGDVADLSNKEELGLRVRYRGEKYLVSFVAYDEETRILTLETDKVLEYAHGQFGVLYDGEQCIGGGEL